jgi:hypothetical protein
MVKTPLTLAQENILYTIPNSIKQKMVNKQFLCQRPYKERIWIALGAGGKMFTESIKNFYKDKNDKFTHIIYIGWSCLLAFCSFTYSLWTSKYEFPHAKNMNDI